MKKCLLLIMAGILLATTSVFAETVEMKEAVPKMFTVNHAFYRNKATQYLGKSYDTVSQSLGTGNREGDSVKYSKYPHSTFYYNKDNICSLIVAPIKDCFDVKGNITLATFNEKLGVEPYIGKAFDFDWFEFNGLLFIIPKTKNDLKPTTIIQVQTVQKNELH